MTFQYFRDARILGVMRINKMPTPMAMYLYLGYKSTVYPRAAPLVIKYNKFAKASILPEVTPLYIMTSST